MIELGVEYCEIYYFDKVQQWMKEKYNILDEEMYIFFIEILKVIDDGYFDVVYD